jgi:hypothetical protein
MVRLLSIASSENEPGRWSTIQVRQSGRHQVSNDGTGIPFLENFCPSVRNLELSVVNIEELKGIVGVLEDVFRQIARVSKA